MSAHQRHSLLVHAIDLATGPRVLRTYRVDDTMNYEHNTVVIDEADLQECASRFAG